ncbi:MAG: D-alanine--D-alanine ligase [Rhodobacteraceae bacterium]|nr:D-alanine--D-alanine ligase [Paracoccaceae bacterium]
MALKTGPQCAPNNGAAMCPKQKVAGMSSRTPPKVAVLMGGPSAEREVSLSSGRECATALRDAGYEVVEIDAGTDLPAQLASVRPDVAFNALHGRWGEDGCVQGLLEWLRIPYTHSGVLASALAMDKERTKAAYRAAGLPVVASVLAPAAEVRARHVMAPPYVVKPNNEGSSVGIYIVHAAADAPPDLSPDMPDLVMVEAYAPGRELTTTVMGDRALTVTDILTDGWYDYDAKYTPGGSHHVVPADLPPKIFAACLDYALCAHRALGCRGVSRTDFRWDAARGLAGLVLLETNTQPGMTPTSLTPEQAARVGISFPDLCDWMIKDASCNR